MFNYRLLCKYINRIISQYLYKNKLFYITNESIYNLANCNLQHIKIIEIIPNIQHKFYNLISLICNNSFSRDISKLAKFQISLIYISYKPNKDTTKLNTIII
jgi:hypothetical protein